MRRLLLVCLLLILSLLLVMSPASAAGWTAEATKLDLIAGPMGTAAYLAPDGSRFAYLKAKELCTYSLAGVQGDCVTFDRDTHIDADTVQWSPDSTKLTFTENFLTTFRDSDIWLYDTQTNSLKDVTPDPNHVKNVLSNDDPQVVFTVDLAPHWSSDSQSIYFIRYSFSKFSEIVPKFYRLNLVDGTVQPVSSALPKTNFRFSVYSFALSPDNSTMAYNLDSQRSNQDGTWFVDAATQEPKFVAAPPKDIHPWTYQFSSDSNFLLIIGLDIKGGFEQREPEASPIYTLPVLGGQQQQVNTGTYVNSAGWGPQSSELAYTTFDQVNPDKEGLYITDTLGQSGNLVLPGRFVVPTPPNRTPILWAANNTILLSQAPDYKLVVVQLKQS